MLQVIAEEDLVERARVRGGYLLDRLHELAARREQVGEVRGRGLLVGLELVKDRHSRTPANQLGAAVTAGCLRSGLSMNIVRSGANANCLRMAPPLTVTRAEIDTAVEILDASIQDALDAGAAGRGGARGVRPAPGAASWT